MNSIGAGLEDGSNGQGSIVSSGLLIGPAGGTAINTTVITLGTWKVRAWFGFDRGAPVAAVDGNNIRVQRGGVTIAVLPVQAIVGRLDYWEGLVQNIASPGGANVSLVVIGAATAGVGYLGGLSMTYVRGRSFQSPV